MAHTDEFKRKLRLGTACALVSAVGAVSINPAYAQDADADDGFEVEEVVVTGSRIVRRDIESVSPLTVTSSEDIKLSGFTRIEDLMNSLPQIEAAQTGFISNGATGTATLDLRGMGANRTLVLMNGRRFQPGGVNTAAPDINQIPASLVERAEVMTGGASATYGADAVAGVVNFIMKDDFEGLEITGGYSAYQHNNRNDYIQGLMDNSGFDYPDGSSGLDGEQYNIDITLGGEFADGKGHATVYATWRKIEELRQESRDYSSCALSTAGTACGGSGNAVVPNFYVASFAPDSPLTPDYDESVEFDWSNWDYVTLDSSNNIISSSGNVYNYAPPNHFQRPDTRWTAGAFMNYELNEHFKPYMELNFMRDDTRAQIAESGTFFAETYRISCSDPLLTAAQAAEICGRLGLDADDDFAAYIGKRNVEGGPRVDNLSHNSFRAVAGVEGNINDNWSYDAYFLYGSTTSSSVYENDFVQDSVREALDVEVGLSGELVCSSGNAGCIPYEVFTYQGISEAAAGNLVGTASQNGWASTYVASGYVTGDLGFSFPTAETPVAVVLGVEYRKESYRNLSSKLYEDGALLGQGGATVSIDGSYNVKEIFTEANIPLVEDAEFAQNLSLELAFRYSDYSSTGSAETYKVGLNWQPIDQVKVRGSYNRAARAPNVRELSRPEGLGLWGGTDNCAGVSPTYTAEQCANTGLTNNYGLTPLSPAAQYNALLGGNPDLEPEVADTYTVGVVLSPLDGWNLSVDWWNIKLDGAIGQIPPAAAINACAETGSEFYCSFVNRSPGGSLWLGSQGYIDRRLLNLGSQELEGIDIASDYATEIGSGMLTAKFVGTVNIKKYFDPVAAEVGEEYECSGVISPSCFPQPKWRHTMTVSYTPDSFWSVSAKWRMFGKVGYELTADTLLADGGIKAQHYFDLKASFDVNENVGLLIGMNNIFDKEPPLMGGSVSTNANTIAGFYDTLGRYLHANVTFSF